MNIIETNWKWSKALSMRAKTTHIVLHHAAAKTCTAAQVDQWHKGNGWSGMGYHYFVRKNGEIYRGRPENAIGAHVSGHNSYTIGICAEGDYSTEAAMPGSQKAAIAALIRDIRTRYPNLKIVGHRDLGGSACPGKYYPLDYFKYYNYNSTGNTESEDLTMAQYEELKGRIDKLEKSVSEITVDLKKTDWIKDIPKWYRKSVEKLYNAGLLEGDDSGALRLDTNMMRMITILDRTGVFG